MPTVSEIQLRLNDRIRLLDKVQKLLKSDPQVVATIIEFAVKGVDGTAIVSELSRNQAKPALIQVIAPQPKTETKRGELLDAVREIIPKFQGEFNSRDLLKALKESGYVFAAKKEKVAISGVLQRLQKRALIRRTDDQKSKANARYVAA